MYHNEAELEKPTPMQDPYFPNEAEEDDFEDEDDEFDDDDDEDGE